MIPVLLLLSFFVSPLLHAKDSSTAYTFSENHHPDGIGKFFKDREIAKVMGHQAAGWLERPEREQEERTDLLLDSLNLKSGETIADIGAGSGYFSWRMAQKIVPEGKVFAVEIQQEMLDLISRNMARRGVSNVLPILGTTQSPKLPAHSVDTILMVDVYHEFDFPMEMLQSMTQSLKRGGRIVWVEFRAEDPAVRIKPLHKMSVDQVRKEAAVCPELQFERTIDVLPQQHIIIFKKL